jgi:hypothetical protein
MYLPTIILFIASALAAVMGDLELFANKNVHVKNLQAEWIKRINPSGT